MIRIEKFVGGWDWWWMTPTTYIQLAGAGSTACWSWINIVRDQNTDKSQPPIWITEKVDFFNMSSVYPMFTPLKMIIVLHV